MYKMIKLLFSQKKNRFISNSEKNLERITRKINWKNSRKTDKHRKTERKRDTKRNKETQRNIVRHRERERERQTDRQTESRYQQPENLILKF